MAKKLPEYSTLYFYSRNAEAVMTISCKDRWEDKRRTFELAEERNGRIHCLNIACSCGYCPFK